MGEERRMTGVWQARGVERGCQRTAQCSDASVCGRGREAAAALFAGEDCFAATQVAGSLRELQRFIGHINVQTGVLAERRMLTRSLSAVPACLMVPGVQPADIKEATFFGGDSLVAVGAGSAVQSTGSGHGLKECVSGAQ
jgi:uncharacterized membrane protein